MEINYSFSSNNNDLNNKKKNEINERKNLTKGKILGGQFILGEEIGKGTFGIVRLATHIITNEKVAVKMLYKERILKEESAKERLEKEIKILKILRHRNIVQLYNVFQTSSTIFLVMEYIKGKELFEIIIKKKKLSELESLLYFQQLISGIEYLSKLGIAHRDLKPENLMIDSKKVLKITDFGLSNTYKKNELLSTPCGSPCYAAPEMLSGNKYNGLGVDIWSSGVILYTMLCGRLPFEDKDNIKLYKKIKEGNYIIPEYLSDNAKDFISNILKVDPKIRYNIIQIKNHPWFNQLDQKKYMNKGLLLNKYIVPIDEEIVDKMKKEYEYNEKEIKMNLLANKHNHITTTYYLFLKQKIKNGKHSIADMIHSEFINYIHNPKNYLANYNGDWNKLFKERAIKKNNINKNSKKISINDDIIITKNINDNKIIDKNEFKEKVEEEYKRKNSQLIEEDNKNEISNKKYEDKNKIEIIKANLNLQNLDKNEKLITINLEEKTKKNNINDISSKKLDKKININTYKKTNSINNSYIQRYKLKTEIMKKPQTSIPKFNTNFHRKIYEDNKQKIKRKTISIKIKEIKIDNKFDNKYNSKTQNIHTTISNIKTKNINKNKQKNKINILSNKTIKNNSSNNK